MKLKTILNELERSGIENDSIQSDKSNKYLNITKDTGEFLSFLIRATQSKRILEIGTSNGYSTLWMASALSDGGSIKTIEISRRKIQEASANFQKAGLSATIEIVEGEAADIVSQLRDEFDMIFLDADRKLYMHLKPKLMKLLKTGGIMVCDNAVSHKEEMKEFMDDLAASPEYSTCLVPVGKGEFLIYKF